MTPRWSVWTPDMRRRARAMCEAARTKWKDPDAAVVELDGWRIVSLDERQGRKVYASGSSLDALERAVASMRMLTGRSG